MCEICRGFHTRPAEGFFCLSPGQPLGTHRDKAFGKLDTVPGDVTPASGYAVIVNNKMHHLGKVPLAKARRVAMSMGNDTTIAEAVGFADVDQLVWRKVENIDRAPGGRFLGDDGELMVKLSAETEIEDMSDAYADALMTEYSSWAKGQLDEYFEIIDVNWYEVDDVEAVFDAAGTAAITDESDIEKLSAAWAASSLLYMNRSAAQAREFAKTAYLPKIGSGISTGDKEAMRMLSQQPGFFLRDQLGRVSSGLTKHGIDIVQRGIRDGIGYREIGKELREQIPGLWGKYGTNYTNVVANVGVQRSRAFAEISAYVEGGIEFAELIAVLDQRTTDTCFSGSTMVATPWGEKRIDRINAGDYVFTGGNSAERVKGVLRHRVNKILRLRLSSGRHIMTTEGHPFLTPSGWVPAGELEKGTQLASQGIQGSQSVGCSNLRAMRKRIRSEGYLRSTGTDAVLFGGVPERESTRGVQQGTTDQEVCYLRSGVQGQAIVGDVREIAFSLLHEMQASARHEHVHLVREGIRIQAVGEEECKILQRGLQGEIQGDDEVGAMRFRRHRRKRADSRTRKANREFLCGSFHSVDERSDRGGWGVLAFGQIQDRGQGEFEEKKRKEHIGTRMDTREDFGRGRQGTHPGEAKEMDHAEYLRRSGEPLFVKAVEAIIGDFEVYNLEVDNDPTYIAEGAVVHNCRFLDGQVIAVDNIVSTLNQTLEITNPEEIKKVAPWISTRKDPKTGTPQLVTRNGDVLADILRSGYGKLDDKGEYAARKMGDQLAVDANIGPPPYHGFCRTTMNPVVKTFTAPAGTWRQAIPTPPMNPKSATSVKTPTFFQGLTGAALVGSIGASDRPFLRGRNPTETTATRIGSPIDPEGGVWAEEGWIDAQTAFSQVKRRISNAAKRLTDAMSELYRAKGRKDLSYKQKGALLRSIFDSRLKEIRSGAVTMEKAEYAFTPHDRVRGDMPRTQASAVRRYALSFLSDRMLRVVSRRKLPRIVQNTSPKGRPTGYWDRSENVFYLPKMETAKARAVVLRVFAEYFDTFRHNGEAAVTARNQSLASDTIYNVNGVLYLDVATASFFDGVIYGEIGENSVNAAAGTVSGSSETESNWTRSAFECLADGFETNLGFLWDTAPEHVAFLLAYIEGQFV